MRYKYWIFFTGFLAIFAFLLYLVSEKWIVYGILLFLFLILPAVIQGNWKEFFLTSGASTLVGTTLLYSKGFDVFGAFLPFMILSAAGAAIKGVLSFQKGRIQTDEKEVGVLYRFAGELSHEIRNPLAAAKSAIRYVISSQGNKEQEQELLGIALNELTRVEEITDKFSSWARLEQLDQREIDMNLLLEEILLGFNNDDKVRMQINGSKTPLIIKGDRTLLYITISNVIRNAFESMPEGGVVNINLSRAGKNAQLEISDTGAGIKPEVLPRIFEPFYTQKNGNTGLGLSIAQRAVRAHGGSIRVKSIPGQGSTFTIHIPVEDHS